MNKLQRLTRVRKLVKLQEHMILAEFRELQLESERFRNKIKEIIGCKSQSSERLTTQVLHANELKTVNSFNMQLEHVIDALQNDLHLTDINYAIVGEKIKEVRTTLLSINRLVEKSQAIETNRTQLSEQKQTEENVNYSQISTS